MLKSFCGEQFAIAAFFNKLLFERSDLLVEQVVRLVNQADQRIGANKRVVMFEPFGVQHGSLLIGQISQIRPMVTRHSPNRPRLGVIFAP